MKRKRFSIILTVILAFVMMAPMLISQEAFAQDYTIKDPILRELLRPYGKPADYNITPEELSRIKYTGDGFMNKGIRTLEGLQYCTNLKGANFYGNPIEDASALSNLKNLKRLNLSGAKIKDLSFIKNGEIDLIDLEINNTGIRDLSPLKKRTEWQYLSASGNHLTDEDIAVFSDMNINNIDVSNNDITDPSVFNHMKNVENFILTGNHISDLSGVGNITRHNNLPISPYFYQASDQTITRFAKNGKVSSIIKDYDGTLLNDEQHLKNFVNVRLNGNEFELIDPNKPGSVEFAADAHEYWGEVYVHFSGKINIVSLAGVMVTPETATVEQGKTQQFTATVVGQGEFDRTVTWSVIGGGAGTSVDANGLLTVAKNETPKTLKVRATSNVNNKIFGEAMVTVKEPTAVTGVTGITVTPKNATVGQGKTQAFAATVSGTGDFDKTVEWSVIGGHEGTSIDADGKLTVADNETAKTLTVKATAKGDKTKSAQATVTVKAKENPVTPGGDNNVVPPQKPIIEERIGGKDRIDTAIEISKKYYSYADNVIIARSDDFPDALTANVLAKALNAPILLTNPGALDGRVKAEIERLGAKNVYIIGKENAISMNTQGQLKALGKVERIGGADRFETSALIAKKVVSLVGRTGKAMIATGLNFADSLSVSPYAAKMGYPILLVRQNQAPKVIKNAVSDLGIKSVYILGENMAVSYKVNKELPKLIARIGGADRYETSAKIADMFFTNAKEAFMASGQVFADALVIGPVAAMKNVPVLLTQKNVLPKAIKAVIDRCHFEKITIVGLQNAVSKEVIDAIK